MMRIAALLCAIGAAAAGVALEQWRDAIPFAPVPAPVRRAAAAAPSVRSIDSLDDAVDLVIANDPFRLANEPASVAFKPRAEGAATPTAAARAAAPRPALVLRAIVGGPPWSAVVDGLPGQAPGHMVRAGETYDQLRVRLVSRDSVVIVAPDTVWNLTFKNDQ